MKKYFNKTNIFLILIIIFALLFRVLDLNKILGLSYDEAITYIDACNIFPFAKNLIGHMPLYFILLNIWMKIFSNSDLCIRLFSVICGVLAVPFAYFTGKSLKDKTCGLVAATFMAINSIAMYYSQEARFYSLILLLSTIFVLYFIKLIKEFSWKTAILFLLSGILLLYTDLISVIFCGIVLLELTIYYIFKNKLSVKNFCINFAILQIILIPIYFVIAKALNSNAQVIFETRYYDNQVIFSLIQNWFSPVITGIYNNVPNSFEYFIRTFSIQSAIFIFIPIIISLLFICKNNYKKPENILLLTLAVLFIGTEIVLSNIGNFIINIRYSIYVLPVLIALIANGLFEFKHKALAKTFFWIYIFVNLFYLIFSPAAAFKQSRISGQKLPAYVFEQEKIGNGDIIVYQIRDNLSDKYYKNTATKYKMINIFINVYPKTNPEIDNHVFYKKVFEQPNSKQFEIFYKNNIYNKLNPGKKLVIVSQTDFIPYDNNIFKKILENDNVYKKQPFLFLKLYKTRELLITNSTKYKLKLNNSYNYKTWNILIFEK